MTDNPRIKYLPNEEKKPFYDWLIGKTVPVLPDVPTDEQDGYYPHDYQRWKKGLLAGLRTFFNIMHAWAIPDDIAARILGTPHDVYHSWVEFPEKANLTEDTLARISHIFGVYKDLQILLPDKEAANNWVMQPNNAMLFNNQAPLEQLREGDITKITSIHQYLDAQLT